MSSWKAESGVRSMLQRPMPCGITRSMVSPARFLSWSASAKTASASRSQRVLSHGGRRVPQYDRAVRHRRRRAGPRRA